ncbi:MAG: response regulator [Gemmatimonadota bacterium]|jgi:DNA-binding NtrC family response regulator
MARILIVDDEETDRLFERAILADAGHELFFAADGEAALEAYDTKEIELVVTDLYMPKLNGLRLIRELIQKDPEALIIAVSGVAADQLDLAERMGAAVTLIKPVDADLLLQAVERLSALIGPRDPWSGPGGTR